MTPARHLAHVAPFRVMQILGRARELEAAGRDIVHMEIGEPDFDSPDAVLRAARAALAAGRTRYTPAAGLPELRRAIAAHYAARFGVEIAPHRVVVTPGASGALQLVLAALVDPGDRVLLTDPGYPCNRHMVRLVGGEPVGIPVHQSDGFALSPDVLSSRLDDRVTALMLASPANPTGNVYTVEELDRINRALCDRVSAALVCDEIYQGLQYEGESHTALELDADNIVVINSFSKYFGMTGWRLGWVIAPDALVEPLERLAQNLFIAPPTLAQYAALVAFGDDNLSVLEQRREIFRQRRDLLHGGLAELGFAAGARPQGAFYVYADASRFTDDTLAFSRELLEHGGVAVTPGADFGSHDAARHVRFAYTTDTARITIGLERLAAFLRAGAD
jgi:aspartate/methionine/tyrosine aminotransferase